MSATPAPGGGPGDVSDGDPGEDVELPGPAQALLDAVVAISSDLDLTSVLQRIVLSACELTGARFGALGVIGSDDNLVEFITHGVDPHEREMIGSPPRGRGILRLLIDRPEPIRLPDLSAHPASYGFPPNHPPMRSFLGVPVRIRGTVFGNLYLTEKSGAAAFGELDERLVLALATAAGFVIENARAYQLSERRRQVLEAAAALEVSLQPPISLDRALSQVTITARGVSGATAAGIVRYGETGAELVTSDGPGLAVLEALVPRIATAGADADEMMVVSLPRTGDSPDVLVLPLRSRLSERCLLVALFDDPRARDYAEQELLASFADQAALALDRAQAIEDREELALISDRDRIARDLHDVVIQRLFATGLQLQGIRSVAVLPEVINRLDKAVDDLDQTIRDIRSTIFELRDRGGAGLRAEVRGIVKDYSPVLGFTPSVRLVGPVDTAVAPAVVEQLTAVLREAVSNIARHAFADHAEIEIRADAGEVVLTVTDDGVGLPEDRTESGLRNARRRATGLGGAFELRPGQDGGTVFCWSAPLRT